MGIEATCPHCEAFGEIGGGHPDVTPTTVRCGACEQTFQYIPTALERVTSEAVAAPETPFYLKPSKGRPGSRKAAEGAAEGQDGDVDRTLWDVARMDRLKGFSTERLLKGLQESRRERNNNRAYIGGLWFTADEMKAELATREHQPSRRERRQQRAQNGINSKGRRLDV
jgi:hypothetical protein